MDDDNSLAAKILTHLEEVIFSNRVEIRQFNIIPAEHDLNKSPVVVAEDCVALESWCVKHIFKSIYDDLLNSRPHFLARRLTDKQLKTVNRFLTGALLINPNIVTFWNMKRQLVEMGRVPVTDELHFSKLALTSAPKSNEIFSYRRWLLSKILDRKRPERMVVRKRDRVDNMGQGTSSASSDCNGSGVDKALSRSEIHNRRFGGNHDLRNGHRCDSENEKCLRDANVQKVVKDEAMEDQETTSSNPSNRNGECSVDYSNNHGIPSSNMQPVNENRDPIASHEPMIVDCPQNQDGDLSDGEELDSIAMPSEMNGSYFDLLLSELLINEYVVKKVPNNYHAFNHRIWLIEKLLPLLGGQLTAKALDLEFKYSTQWIGANISHHTGYAYRQFLIKCTKSIKTPLQFHQDFIRDFRKDKDTILDIPQSNYVSCLLYDLYRLTADLAIFRNENESLWYHRRFLLHSLLAFIRQRYEGGQTSKVGGEEGLKEAKVFKTDLESCALYKLIKDKEVEFAKQNMGGACSAVQKYWTERHCKWLRNVLGVDWVNYS